MPVLFTRCEPHDVAGSNFFNRAAVALHPAKPADNDQRLPQRMGMPGRACARFEGDIGPRYPRRVGTVEQRVDANDAGEPIAGPLTEGCVPMRLISMVIFLCATRTVLAFAVGMPC